MTRVVVVKLGGSVLAQHELPQRLRAWLSEQSATQPNSHFAIVVGGGKLVDAVREMDAREPIGDEPAHWICVELMGVTAALVAAMLPEIPLVSEFSDLERRIDEPGATLIRPMQFLQQVERTRPGARLPTNWSVTSDSISARLAIVLGADELVLLKSVPPPIEPDHPDRLSRLTDAGYIDAFLPTLAGELKSVRFENLAACRKPIHHR